MCLPIGMRARIEERTFAKQVRNARPGFDDLTVLSVYRSSLASSDGELSDEATTINKVALSEDLSRNIKLVEPNDLVNQQDESMAGRRWGFRGCL